MKKKFDLFKAGDVQHMLRAFEGYRHCFQ